MEIKNQNIATPKVIKTTIGDLVAAMTEIAVLDGKTEAEGYVLASVLLERFRRNSVEPTTMVH